MSKRKTLLAAIACVVMAFSFCLAGCGSDSGEETAAAPEKHLLPYPEGYDTTSAGASSYDGWCDNAETPYFTINDYYNMESEGSLHILTNFAPYQQSTEYTCGPASCYAVLNWFDPKLAKKYDELTIADMSGTDETKGVNPAGLKKFFDEIGWYTQCNFSTDEYFKWDSKSGDPLLDFENFCVKNIDNGVPIMVDWIDWDGHWQTIIGIDTCQEDNPSDDVLIFADPYDTSDQYQDGYYTFGAERFFYMWHEGACSGMDEPGVEPFLIAMPKEKAKELGMK
ncbi:MAG: C39 family peptidase [Bacillota bacterium]|nr:C39 family peptidase [Bacillota bacterium]